MELALPMRLVGDQFAMYIAAKALLGCRASGVGCLIRRAMLRGGAVVEGGRPAAQAPRGPRGLEGLDLRSVLRR